MRGRRAFARSSNAGMLDSNERLPQLRSHVTGGAMDQDEREILEALDAAVRTATATLESISASVDRKLEHNAGELLTWESVPLDRYRTALPESIRSSWVFVLRANVATGAERHPNSHQRMLSYRGSGDFQTQPGHEWRSHHLRSDPSAPLEQRWISIPPNVWHQGVVGSENWAVVSFHTVPAHELVEERRAADIADPPRRRRYLADEELDGGR
jgi:hypothetical protein